MSAETIKKRRDLILSSLTSGPGIVWVCLFLLVPLISVMAISFLTRGEYGDIEWTFTFDNYKRFFGYGIFGFDPLYPIIIVRSFILAAGTAALCVLAALPLAFFISFLPPRYKGIALTLVIIPFWTNLLIRTYAWQILLAPGSILSNLVHFIGIVPEDVPALPSAGAVYAGMVCDFLPYMVLPLYTSIEKIDWKIAEAAMDLGGNGRRVFRHAVLPQIMPGLVAGIILVFIPALGQYVIPDLLGGAKTVMLGNAIGQQFGASRDWPFGSAIAFFAMGIVMMGLWLYARVARKHGEEALL